jgi:polyhydroxyalkanoate synthesis regulator phasin
MVAPVIPIVWGILKLSAAAITAYELYDLSKTLYDGVGDFKDKKDKAKAYVREIMKSLQNEINGDIDEKLERQLLATLTEADVKEQSEITRDVKGRKGDGTVLIKTAIKMPMPFRKQLSQICDLADKVPVISLRRKKGVKLHDLPKAKQKILIELLALTLEELADVDLDNFIVVRLKQLMAAHLLEFMDELLGWQSPMKAEACFGPQFEDPPVKGTQLTREGGSTNPFYPLPHRGRGSISIDVAITDYRKEPLTKSNLFGIVEIKFPGDKIKNEQFKRYKELSDKCGDVKTTVVGQANTLEGKGVRKGARVSLFRYPEDRAKSMGGMDGATNNRKKGPGGR